jgi:hypothetical protein
MTEDHNTAAFEHPCPQSGVPNCHHVHPTNCHFCWDHLINRLRQAEMNRQDFAEMAEFGKDIKRWADGQRIEDIPAAYDRLQASRSTSAEQIRGLEGEVADLRRALDQAMAGLHEAVSRLPKRRRGGFERFA